MIFYYYMCIFRFILMILIYHTPLLDALKVIYELRFVRSSELIPVMYVETKYDFWKIPAVPTLKRFFQNYFLNYFFA